MTSSTQPTNNNDTSFDKTDADETLQIYSTTLQAAQSGLVTYEIATNFKISLEFHWLKEDMDREESYSYFPDDYIYGEEIESEVSPQSGERCYSRRPKPEVSPQVDKDDFFANRIETEISSQRVEFLIGMSDQFNKQIRRIDAKLRGRVLEALTILSREPTKIQGDTIKPLSGDLIGCWRYRIGDYRLIYYPDDENRRVTLLVFDSRGNVYDN